METYQTREQMTGNCVLTGARTQCIEDGELVSRPGIATWLVRQPRPDLKPLTGRDYNDMPACANHAFKVAERGWQTAHFSQVTFAGEGDPEKTDRPRCTCGALIYSGCFCEISISDFLATSPNRTV